MPFGDGTGPAGLGPMTGRGLGFCAGFPYPGYLNPLGFGWGRGWGRGFGWRRFWGWWPFFGWRRFWGPWPYPPSQPQITKKEEKEILEEEVKALEEEIKAIKARLAELKGEK